MNSIDHRNRTISISSDDDDDTGNIGFFETLDRIPSGITVSFVSSGSDCDEDELSRLSFVSAIAPPIELQCFENSEFPDFDVWISEPSSIKDRRKKLFQGLGLANDKKNPRSESINNKSPVPEIDIAERTSKICHQSSSSKVIIRSKSDVTVERNAVHNVVLFRSASSPSFLCGSDDSRQIFRTDPLTRSRIKGRRTSSPVGLCKIKNLDTGTEFIVDEYREDGMWNRLSELQTGKQLTMEEFEKNVGYSPIVKELMRREQVKEENNMNSIGSDLKCGKSSKKKGSWLKNIKGVANSVTGFMVDKERDSVMERTSKNLSSSSEWMRVRRHGKPYKEFTGLYMCQEIRAHEGSIWSIRFSHDARYLASAGEDRVIHVWEVVERDVHGNSESLAPIASDSPDRANITECQSPEKKKKGKTGRKSSIPDHVVVPDSVFALSEKPVCSFQGHLDDILDLSWSKSYHLLSSSMDKTVRLWNMETKSCLKLFAHNDYVTCIQFNPMDDRYFISGSLDAKVRIWSIPDHQVVDWSDLHEMVTAACYTPDGQGALVGSHKGYCRLYDTSDSKLHQRGQIECKSKRKKSCAKKITGFQFTPGNPSEVLITSADSQIRVYNGIDIVQKFRGFRNTNSQISASYTSDGKYVVCASEDSHVYIWKREECQTIGANGKNKVSMTVRSHEHFQCRDVSVAIPWPGGFEKCELPIMPLRARRPSRCHQSGRYNLQPPPPSSGPSNLEIGNSWRNTNYRDDDIAIISSHSDSNGGSSSGGSNSSSSFTSASSILSAGLSSVLSSVGSASSYWGGGGGGNNSSSIEVSTAWGLVVVTAGLGGEIRTYQNFGLPLRLNRQSTLFECCVYYY